ncbi:MAG: methylenetetrahydrofolate reductase [NAD(P)H] [Deltaproteobacteria bacterium]
MRISELFAAGGPVFSFEFFPPKTDKGKESLKQTIAELCPLNPGFVSVTYGAGGSTRDLTVELVSYIKNQVGLEAMAHLTCVGSSRDEISTVLDRLEAEGIENLIALRGDPPQGEREFVPHPQGLAYATDLIQMIRDQKRPFCLVAAGYPEGHVESPSPGQDLDYLVEKVRNGAEVIITQLFFDNTFYLDFVRQARNLGINVPIVPGIMPITNVDQIERFTKMCGATIPADLHSRLDDVRQDKQAVARIGTEHAIDQCMELLSCGAPGVHFYTLNRSDSTQTIVKALAGQAPS